MEDKKIQEVMKTEYHKMTQGPGLYQLNTAPTLPQSVLPFSPTLISQRGGVSTVNNVSLVDIDSDLMNINRKLTLDPSKKYSPDVCRRFASIETHPGMWVYPRTSVWWHRLPEDHRQYSYDL